MADGGLTNYSSPVFVADGSWHHVAVTVSRALSTGILFYLDGVATQFGDPTLRSGSLSCTSPLRIGCESYSVDSLFSGTLDEIELFNRVLNPSEVVAIFSAGSAGKCKPAITTGINSTKELPKQFGLFQAYPNPFNPTVTIRYDIPKTSCVKISVFDVLGKEVKVLVDEEKSPGQYNIVFNAQGFASGIYFYIIQAGEYAQNKKMILLK